MVIENIEKRIKISTATCEASFEKAPLSNEGPTMIIFCIIYDALKKKQKFKHFQKNPL